MVQTKSIQGYKLEGTPVVDIPVPIVGNLINDELGKVFLAKLNEKFRGNNQIAYIHEVNENNPIQFSNIPRNLYANQVIREETGNTHVQSPEEMVQYWDKLPEKSFTYADSSAVSVFPREGPNETLRKRVLDILGKDKTEIPLLVLGLGVDPLDNPDSFTFTETPYLKVIEAPYLEKDQKVKYDPKTQTIVPSDDDTGVEIWTPSDQSGLRRAYRLRDVVLGFWGVNLFDSVSDGRVPFFQNPQGSAENLDIRIEELEAERDKQRAEVDSRYKKALNFLKTGKL